MEHLQPSRLKGIDTAFYGNAAHEDMFLSEIDGNSGSRPDLPFDHVSLGQHLSNTVFHLKSHVHFHEPELTGSVQQEFKSSHSGIPDLLYSFRGLLM